MVLASGTRWQPATVDTKNTNKNTNTTGAFSPATETSAGEITSNPLVCGSWHWLLAPDGSPAMVGKKAEEEAVESGTRSTTSEECKRRRGPVAQHSWHWLLAPDGSPATAEHSTASRVATGGKRKRGAAPEGERYASRPTSRSYRRRTDAISADSFETDDEHISCETVDEDDLNWIHKHQHAQWKEKFELLVEYKNKHKTTRVPSKDPVLGVWVNDQRRRGRSGRLTKCRRQCLESLGFEFDICMLGWMEMYNQLLQYKEQHHGSLNVSRERSNKHLKLASWVYQQRVCFDTNRLSDERTNLLESIEFDWQLSKKGGDRNAWMEMYQRLRAYKEKYKSTCVPKRFKADPKLGNWVIMQRSRCKEKYRIDLLNDIGFERNPHENHWIEMYQRLLVYRKRYQNTRVPRSFEDSKLAIWVNHQRHYCSEKKRVKFLDDIGFEWKIGRFGSNRCTTFVATTATTTSPGC